MKKRAVLILIGALLFTATAYTLGWSTLFIVSSVEIKGTNSILPTSIKLGQKLARVQPRATASEYEKLDWVKNADGSVSLHVVESAQINMKNKKQKEIFEMATHFNPVDLICAVKNHKKLKYDLLDFRDPTTGFITEKSQSGKILKAQELPGLWNGAMANWNTLFVEVPLITFNPVKTVNDLLRMEHQPA